MAATAPLPAVRAVGVRKRYASAGFVLFLRRWNERQAAAERAAAEQAAAAARSTAEQQAAAERAAAEQEARNQSARVAQVALAPPAGETYFPDCDAARAAGRGPIARGELGYRSALDPNANGVACEGTTSAAAAAPAPAPSPTRTAAAPATPAPVTRASGSARGQRAVDAALRYLGTTYAWGGGDSSGPTLGIRDGGVADSFGDYKKVGFDCSGLTLYGWAQVGVNLPHYSAYQYAGQPKISRDQLQPGDLVFYATNTSDPTTIHHVAMWMGNNQVVEARNSGTLVKISPMRWDGYIGAVRPGG